jgi:hypothetical protein
MSGTLVEAESGHYAGPLVTNNGCSSGVGWVDVYRQ